ncbi:uncharacterized protein LOC128718296 [Anopheles marshallii]|uniref:uncharacterized protein LOC128718296 n=1 Tax=Anopheles marshallii TaxID=1521116 RepID=UPI00237A6263|nr:uncharacterized protein LOC128718296 [Anopheles marshallii]
MQVRNIPEIPIMILGIYCGMAKPNNVEGFLRPLVTEINHILVQGILINDTLLDIRLRTFIADTPARAFIKGVKSFNSIHGCIKCKIIGTYIHAKKKTVFVGTAEDRTDEEFRRGEYTQHQTCYTPLLDVDELDIIKDIIVADSLHILYLGLTKTLLKAYIFGTMSPFQKWLPREERAISKLLVGVQYPSEIHRKARALYYIKFWKGSELASFLHHCAIPLLKNRISDRAYNHLKLFFLAVTFLSSAIFEQYWEYAGQLLHQFVSEFSEIYSSNYLTSNVHNLLHILPDVQRFGPLTSISSYPFENKLQFIKNLVRTGHRSLNQVVCRVTELRELEAADKRIKDTTIYPSIKNKNNEVIFFVKANFVLRKGNRNGWFFTHDNQIVRYSKASEISGKFCIEGHPMLTKQPSFTNPTNSEIIYCYMANAEDISDSIIMVDLDNIKGKLACITLDMGKTLNFSPLLHTFTA